MRLPAPSLMRSTESFTYEKHRSRRIRELQQKQGPIHLLFPTIVALGRRIRELQQKQGLPPTGRGSPFPNKMSVSFEDIQRPLRRVRMLPSKSAAAPKRAVEPVSGSGAGEEESLAPDDFGAAARNGPEGAALAQDQARLLAWVFSLFWRDALLCPFISKRTGPFFPFELRGKSTGGSSPEPDLPEGESAFGGEFKVFFSLSPAPSSPCPSPSRS